MSEEQAMQGAVLGRGVGGNPNVHDIGWAVKQMHNGSRVRRAGWNGKGMFLFLVPEWTYTDGKQDNYPNAPFVAMKTAQGYVVPWLCSQADLLAVDWEVAYEQPSAQPNFGGGGGP